MAILPMARLTILGGTSQKPDILNGLQSLGAVHLITYHDVDKPPFAPGVSAETHEAFGFLEKCPEKRRQARDPENFIARKVEKTALKIKRRIRALDDEHDYLLRYIKALEPWGDFNFPPVEQTGGYRFWFYIVPHYRMSDVKDRDIAWECVCRDARFSYVVVVSRQEPENMPVPRTHTGDRPLSRLKQRLEDVEVELDELHWKRVGLTRWLAQFSQVLAAADDRNTLDSASREIYDDGELFVVEGWAPKSSLAELRNFAADHALILKAVPPPPEEKPPTLLANPEKIRSGEKLVTFYTTPGYHGWDPSLAVLFSFVIFFAMIVSDAGYGLLLGLLWLLSRRKLKCAGQELCTLFGFMVAGTMGYGVLAGNYFGLAPPTGSLLGRLKFFEPTDQYRMMTISILLGALHLLLAHGINFIHAARPALKLRPLGWIAVIGGGLLIWFAHAGLVEGLRSRLPGVLLVIGGSLLILCFSSQRPWRTGNWQDRLGRLLDGLLALGGLSRAFGDVLSYLRIFALGLASAQLAATFNDMASGATSRIAGLGTLVAILTLVLGHGLNFLLALMSGVVHGLRLNYIEFFNWGMTEEGYPYRPFRKKGGDYPA
ncbi:MAG: V-type ATPase 116kDa subunit family protein [Desulfurivibrionaceae bacterium]|nr:V-type ATPase 116kDa subunit family protein [Desulfurivibrionaceae bacterium]